MSDRLRELTAFVRAGETGSFSRVARELGVSQPSISRMVGSLEARLGVKLLLRTTRHVTPTDAGRVFLERARQILGELDDAENVARGVESLRGTLRVALSGAFGIREVIPRLPGFAAQHPKLGIELLMSDRTEDLIAEGADMAGVNYPELAWALLQRGDTRRSVISFLRVDYGLDADEARAAVMRAKKLPKEKRTSPARRRPRRRSCRCGGPPLPQRTRPRPWKMRRCRASP